MERHFDAFLYLYDSARAWATPEHVILNLDSEDEDGDWEHDGEGWLASIVPVRNEVDAGDTRLLYLAWLLCVQAQELDDDVLEPPVPAGLAQLSGPLRSLADFLRLDQDLLAAAAEASGPLTVTVPSAAAMTQWVKGLPDADKDAILVRLLHGADAQLRAELVRRFQDEQGNSAVNANGSCTAGQLLEAAEAHCAHRQRLAEQRQAAERALCEQQAAAAREQRLRVLAGQGEQAWQQVIWGGLPIPELARRSLLRRVAWVGNGPLAQWQSC